MSLTTYDLQLIRAAISEEFDDCFRAVGAEATVQRNDRKELYTRSRRHNRCIDAVYINLRASGRNAQQAFKLIEANTNDIKQLARLISA